MNALAITAILAIGLLATIIASVASVSDLIYREYNDQIIQVRLEQAAAAIEANAIVMNGVRYVPAADDSGSYAAIPAWVMPNARSPSGVPFHYCPYAAQDLAGTMPSNTVTTTNNKPSGGTYAANTINIFNHAYTRSHNYVYARARPTFTGAGASLAPSDVLALIVAPMGKNAVTSDCTGTLDTLGNTTIGNHYIRVVNNPQPVQQQLTAKNETAVFYVGASASGNGSGIDPDNRITLDGAFAQLHAMQPWRAHLFLASGSYNWTNGSQASAGHSYGKGNFRQLEYILDGPASGTPSIAVNSDVDLPVSWQLHRLTLNFNGSYVFKSPPMNTVIVDSANISGPIQLNGGTMKVLGSAALNNGINVTDGGRLVINGTVTSYVNTGGIIVRGGGRINILGDQSWSVYDIATSTPTGPYAYQLAPIWLRTGGRLTVQGTLNILPATGLGGNLYAGLASDIGSELIVAKSTLSTNKAVLDIVQPVNHAIYLNGAMHVQQGLLQTDAWLNNNNAYIYLINGGELTLHDGTVMGDSADVNKRPQIGVMDKSGNSVFGGDTSQDGSAAVTIYVNAAQTYSRCWAGDPSLLNGSYYYQYPHLFVDSSTTGNGSVNSTYASDIGKDSSVAGTSEPKDRSDFEYLRLQNISQWNCVRN